MGKNPSIVISDAQFSEFLTDVFGMQKYQADVWLRVERPIKKEHMDVEAIRVYLPELSKNINSTVERGERPVLLIKRTVREKTGKGEVEIVFMGSVKDRHIEDLSYYTKNPQEWRSWGEIVLTLDQARKFAKFLDRVASGDKDTTRYM